tara:strand:+ start:1057 stop:1413 length:357 start_codon:yes stop_codon:yes gene_type:complete
MRFSEYGSDKKLPVVKIPQDIGKKKPTVVIRSPKSTSSMRNSAFFASPRYAEQWENVNPELIEAVSTLVEKNVPTDKSKWSYYKSQAKKKFKVYPSAYANAWAAKKYKAAGGSWRKGK